MSGLVSDNAKEFSPQGKESHHNKRNLFSSRLQLPSFQSALLAAVVVLFLPLRTRSLALASFLTLCPPRNRTQVPAPSVVSPAEAAT